MSWDNMHLIGKQDTPAADEYPVASAASAWAATVSGGCRRLRGSKHKVRSDKGKKRKVRAFLSCDDNALEEMFRLGALLDADSSPRAARPPVCQVTHLALRMTLKWNTYWENSSKRTCKTLFTLFFGLQQ